MKSNTNKASKPLSATGLVSESPNPAIRFHSQLVAVSFSLPVTQSRKIHLRNWHNEVNQRRFCAVWE